MMPVAVVTAKAHSSRLPGKNMLPLGDAPMAVWTLREAAESVKLYRGPKEVDS